MEKGETIRDKKNKKILREQRYKINGYMDDRERERKCISRHDIMSWDVSFAKNRGIQREREERGMEWIGMCGKLLDGMGERERASQAVHCI